MPQKIHGTQTTHSPLSSPTDCRTTRQENQICPQRALVPRYSSLLASTRGNRLVRLVCEVRWSMEALRSSQYSSMTVVISENLGWLGKKKNNGKPLAAFYSSRLRQRDFSTLRRTPQMEVALPKPALLRCSMLAINLSASLLLHLVRVVPVPF